MRPWEPPEGGKERYLRWMEMLWERHQTNAREEGRTREVIDVLEGLAELSRRRVKPPRFPPWEPPW